MVLFPNLFQQQAENDTEVFVGKGQPPRQVKLQNSFEDGVILKLVQVPLNWSQLIVIFVIGAPPAERGITQESIAQDPVRFIKVKLQRGKGSLSTYTVISEYTERLVENQFDGTTLMLNYYPD
ncbi:hypothetical protein FGO68_gene15949 [Halteria grandinella]|uniref:Uncharacterized protein n=1 Tax=Halteria grandinella TaxID=5974 RepID=A0A8J8SUB1_HALGN|nr:hypothetical protein FGO68_gene15949 [Halteria grandinella]